MLWTVAMLACARPPSDDADAARRLDRFYAAWSLTTPDLPTVDATTLRQELASETPPVLVDVRPSHERAVSVLPGAVALETWEANRDDYAGRPVVTYCTVGVRSGYVALRLAEQGVDVRNFRGSILAWTHIGGPLVTPAGERTDDVHVYGRRWNWANSAYDAFVGDPPEKLP